MKGNVSSSAVASLFLIAFDSALFLGQGSAGSSIQTGAEVDVTEELPAPVAEEVAPSPGPGFIWIGGAWVWHDGWVWERGRWERPPYPGAAWVPHRYIAVGNGKQIFILGGWR